MGKFRASGASCVPPTPLPSRSFSPSLNVHFGKRGSYPPPLPLLGLPWVAQGLPWSPGPVGVVYRWGTFGPSRPAWGCGQGAPGSTSRDWGMERMTKAAPVNSSGCSPDRLGL